MTVKELIEKLQSAPQDAKIYRTQLSYVNDGGGYMDEMEDSVDVTEIIVCEKSVYIE